MDEVLVAIDVMAVRLVLDQCLLEAVEVDENEKLLDTIEVVDEVDECSHQV